MLTKRYASAQDPDGVIDLERFRSGPPTSLERDAAGFLEPTCPSSDVHALVRGLSNRFNGGSQIGTMLDAMDEGGALISAAPCKVTGHACTAKSKTLPGGGAELRC